MLTATKMPSRFLLGLTNFCVTGFFVTQVLGFHPVDTDQTAIDGRLNLRRTLEHVERNAGSNLEKQALLQQLLDQVKLSGKLAEANKILAAVEADNDSDTKIQLLLEFIENEREDLAAKDLRSIAPPHHGKVVRFASSPNLTSAAAANGDGGCSWEALSRESRGRWKRSSRRAFRTSCPYMKERYKCDWDRGWKYRLRWVPGIEDEGLCRSTKGVRGGDVAEALGRPVNILILGNSILRELYETIVCEHEREVVHYENFAHKDDLSNAVLRSMELIYIFRDYNATDLHGFLPSHAFGKGRRGDGLLGPAAQRPDVVITNYRPEHIEAALAALPERLVDPLRPLPVIYSSHACARGSRVQVVVDLPKEMQYVRDVRAMGLPVFDLCTASRAAVEAGVDVQARKEGRGGDPHLCMPGPHIDMMESMFQMMIGLLGRH
uniref:Uncharacterized protein n=1 Tax=Tetraselmis sp. GSL018 TaxID=582737 RepID=A0A061RF34_9CHLO